MKRSAEESSPIHNPKRKLRNRYQSESQCIGNERGISTDGVSNDENNQLKSFEMNRVFSQEMDSMSTSNKDSQEILVDDDLASVTVIATVDEEIEPDTDAKPKEIQEENTLLRKSSLPNAPTTIPDTNSQDFQDNNLSFKNSVQLLKSPTLPTVKDAQNSQDMPILEPKSNNSLAETSHISLDGPQIRIAENTGEGKKLGEATIRCCKDTDNCVNDPLKKRNIDGKNPNSDITDDDTDDETSKDNASRCSLDDTCDKSYRVNVGLFGTDIEEDLTRDENDSLSVPSKTCPDMNNNLSVPVQQSNDDSQSFITRKRSNILTDGSLRERPMEEGSNTVDGFTRRALESHCNITDTQNKCNETTQIDERLQVCEVSGMNDTSSNALAPLLKTNSNGPKLPNPFKEPVPDRPYPTDFSGLFKQGETETTTGPRSCLSSENLPQSYGSYYRQQDSLFCKGSTPTLLSPRYPITSRQGILTSPLNVDENIVAEQLASELVQTYSGENSHMISDILRRRAEVNYCSTVTNTAGHRQFEDLATPQNVVHDVDLLNTPQQLPLVDSDFSSNQCYIQGPMSHTYRNPNTLLTPEIYRRNSGRHHPSEMQGKVTYNDIQVYGGKWSANNRQETVPAPSFHQDFSENPYPHHQESPIQLNEYSSNTGNRNCNKQQSHIGAYPSQPSSNIDLHDNENVHNDYRQFNIDTHLNKSRYISPRAYSGSRRQGTAVYPQSPDPLGLVGMGGGSRPAHEVTKMTFTPRGVMQTHLSQNNQKPRGVLKQPISDVDYSSIYPTRDYIDGHLSGESFTPAKMFYETQPSGSRFTKQQPRQKRQYKPSKYDQIPLRAPPMPIFDEMMSKYPPGLSKETEPLNMKHKYVVVNPSGATEMPSRTLLLKYIDFLILENEQITDISQSFGPTEDIYVTEDMYFMDTLKYMIPFPSKKFKEWVGSFFPKLDLTKMKFKGRYPDPRERGIRMSDPRPTQQILEDTFYYFQRAVMNLEGLEMNN